MKNRLQEIHLLLGQTIGAEAEASEAAVRSIDAVEKLQSRLDHLLYEQVKDHETDELARVYYPGDRDEKKAT